MQGANTRKSLALYPIWFDMEKHLCCFSRKRKASFEITCMLRDTLKSTRLFSVWWGCKHQAQAGSHRIVFQELVCGRVSISVTVPLMGTSG